MTSDLPDCSVVSLKFPLGLSLYLHLSLFLYLLGFYLRLLKRMHGMYFMSVAFCMFVVQYFLFNSSTCYFQTPLIYVWLAVQVAAFYAVLAIGINIWLNSLGRDKQSEIIEEVYA
jgi:hypothetical protein